ncbi:hypothetical protein N8586_01690 [Verrucomicrobiales bacterium]|nr:hypothetical protein [Verrucomicrobiales bacterium]
MTRRILALWIVLFVVSSQGNDWSGYKEFVSEIYPMLTQEQPMAESCVACHDSDGTSDLVFFGQPKEDFAMLRQTGYLKTEGPDTLLGRITSTNPKRRMPKGKHAQSWDDDDIKVLSTFLTTLNASNQIQEVAADERFPDALLEPYVGQAHARRDSQFLTYHQLRGKVETIFNDTWVRYGKDRFEENVALFGGADFKSRFNESSQPSSSFLTALDLMAREVNARAYTTRTGPFADHPIDLPVLSESAMVHRKYREEMTRLYQEILFRAPTDDEIADTFTLFKSIQLEQSTIAKRDYDLVFQLKVSDPTTALDKVETVRIPVQGNSSAGYYQALLDQTGGKAFDDRGRLGERLDVPFRIQEAQLIIQSPESIDEISFAGVVLTHCETGKQTVIDANSPQVKALGAWELANKGDSASLEDEGEGSIIVSLSADNAEYWINVLWRKGHGRSKNVFVEVLGAGHANHAIQSAPAVPPEGQADFYYNCSDDTRPFFSPDAAFFFHPHDYVEITNAGTNDLVTIGALTFVSPSDRFTINSREAAGNELWGDFKSKSFGAYNQKGNTLSDEGKTKGELFLQYHPGAHTSEHENCTIQISYAGKRGQEARVPVSVHAYQSSPITQLVFPAQGHAGGQVTLDASASYTTHRATLDYEWTQLEGPPVSYSPSDARLAFALPQMNAKQSMWQALGRALMRHPDFLFTRPPAVATASDAHEKQRLLLVKLALDLVGRSPSNEELALLDSGEDLESMVDHYLASREFEKFYYHRIRLYLESQGTKLQDEPARLWSYIALNDRPFQEILTADYTVNVAFEKSDRPKHHGRTGVLTTPGFIDGKPGLPHYNYAAQVSMLFLGYVYEVPPEIVEQREGTTAEGTTDPQSTCYSCHKILTPLAHQRNYWTDMGKFRKKDDNGNVIDASDHDLVSEYPFKGSGMQAFATQAVKKERFIRTIIDTHFTFYFGRQMRYRQDERALYKAVWDAVHADDFKIRTLIRALVTSPEYLEVHE